MSERSAAPWEIRQPAPDDALAAAEMQAVSWTEAYGHSDDEAKNQQARADAAAFLTDRRVERRAALMIESVDSDEKFYRIAKVGRQVIGLIYGEKTAEQQEFIALYVDKTYHGQGAARDLTSAFIDWADPQRPIELGVDTNNHRAQGFYGKMGFADTPRRRAFNEYIEEMIMLRPPEETV